MAISPEHSLTSWLGTTMVMAHVNDPDFMKFLSDHIDILKSAATVAEVTPDRMAQSRYSVSGWLLDMGLPAAYAPIFCMINDLHGDHDFVNLTRIRTIPVELITEYWSIYSSVQLSA